MEAQAAAQQLAAQQAVLATTAAQPVSPVKREAGCGPGSPAPHLPPTAATTSDEPTDLSVGGRGAEERDRERAERERYYSQLMERYNIERSSPARERSEEREEPRTHFDYRHLIPQVSIKTETC